MKEYIRVQRLKQGQPQYKTDCMEGEAHPLDCEYFVYKLVKIGFAATDKMASAEEHYRSVMEDRQFLPEEQDAIKSFAEEPHAEWAIANSFDGLYAHVVQDPSRWETRINFAVYMEEKHHTFWKLKYA